MKENTQTYCGTLISAW